MMTSKNWHEREFVRVHQKLIDIEGRVTWQAVYFSGQVRSLKSMPSGHRVEILDSRKQIGCDTCYFHKNIPACLSCIKTETS